jgi:hypothetical protein
MTAAQLEQVKAIADAVLYEGYLLYPYRASSLKNRQRCLFGRLYPRTHSEAQGGVDSWIMQTECLVVGHAKTRLGVQVRFLQLTAQREPVEREVVVAELPLGELLSDLKSISFAFDPLEGTVELSARRVEEECYQLTVRVLNHTPAQAADLTGPDTLLLHTLVSVHAVLGVWEGQFISLLDPPEHLRPLAARCHNVGTWPVLVGKEGERDTMLSAPIILYDYPQVAPESMGDFFDGTEVDELLTLRVLTLTEEEKREVRSGDGHARALLDRTEGLTPEQMRRLHGHGVMRDGAAPSLRPGVRVRLRPRGGADAMDIVLRGKAATIVAVEQDFEGRIHLAVTVDDDPGQDLGREGKPGHRFFFRPEEVEPLAGGWGEAS